MEWEIVNDGNMLEIPGVIIAYIIFFIIGIINVKKWVIWVTAGLKTL